MPELEILTYEEFGRGVRFLAEQLVAEDWIPDCVLGIVRGGLFVAAGIAYALDIKDVRDVNVEFYTGMGTTLDEPVIVGQEPYLADLGGRRVLVADDVADSGATLEFVHRLLPLDTEVRAAVLYAKPGSRFEADLTWRVTDRWIRFPWTPEPPVLPHPRQASAQPVAPGP